MEIFISQSMEAVQLNDENVCLTESDVTSSSTARKLIWHPCGRSHPSSTQAVTNGQISVTKRGKVDIPEHTASQTLRLYPIIIIVVIVIIIIITYEW